MTNKMQHWEIPNNLIERDEAIHRLFPEAMQLTLVKLRPSFRGGRQQALIKLSQVNGEDYGKTRNFSNGEVTHLSPYLRHGCITLKEAVTSVRERFGLRAEKLLFEFAWREYWRTVWYAQGMNIFQALQAPKVLLAFNALPTEVKTASTGLPCMDGFILELAETGYLHNHARMWLAAYLVHWRKTDWRKAALWMHDQLLDGDYASNHLSWQWIASTFSHKPYFFNQENLAKYTNNQYCEKCHAHCPFKDSYANLEQKLFKPTDQTARQYEITSHVIPHRSKGNQTMIWVHDEMLNPEHSLMKLSYEKIFIFDPDYYKNWSMLRLKFIADCLAELPNVTVWIGNTGEIFEHLNVGKILTQETPNLKLKQQILGFLTAWHAEEKVCEAEFPPQNITSFTRFWKVAAPNYLGDSLNQH